MKLPAIIKIEVTGLKEVIDLQAKYDELQRGLGDLFLTLVYPEVNHNSLLNKNSEVSWMIGEVSRIIKENRELKEKRDEII